MQEFGMPTLIENRTLSKVFLTTIQLFLLQLENTIYFLEMKRN